MNFKAFKNKLWFNIFIRIAVIFAVFVIILCVSNVSLLVRFFGHKEKTALAEQLVVVSKLDFDDSDSVIKTLNLINEKYNFHVEIYNQTGAIIYTTHGGQMLDFFYKQNDMFSIFHQEMQPIKTEILDGGIIFETAVEKFDKTEYLLCKKQVTKNLFAEVKIQKQFIDNSATIANEFIVIISSVCFIISIIWVLIFAKQFSKPITEMSKITLDMSNLNFERRLKITRTDEIGELAASINNLSSSLSSALSSLEKTNEKLRNDIELERQIDVMRKGFIANVSHELKTPLSIISGYAEGLKLNVNTEAKEEYCNTIIDESQRMNKLVLSILELSRYESGLIQINKSNFDISELSEKLCKRIFINKNISVENKIPQKTYVFADEFKIEQVIKSLLENAYAHTPINGNVEVSCKSYNNNYKISVFNSGSYIDEEIMPHIWQSFFRGDKSHKRDSSRFGLGLSIVAAITKLHGKSCGVNNRQDGVEFWFEVQSGTPEISDDNLK